MSIDLPPSRIDAGELLQHVSRVVYRDEPLCYGRDGTNRYDAPKRDYGVLYLGRNLPTALMDMDWPGFVENYRIGVVKPDPERPDEP